MAEWLERGQQIRYRATGMVGLVLETPSSDLVEVSLPDGVKTLHIDDLEPAGSSPDQRLLRGELAHSTAYGLRLQAEYLRHAYRYDPVAGLSNARIEPKLHQVYAAHRVVEKLRPRMILADEVGLGKTIEAGLILKELRARGLVERVLIVVPASLQLQWRSELRSKFNEEFEIYDGQAVKFHGKGGDNPWSKADNIIASIPLASRDANATKIAEVNWDLVIFDEAHRVRRWRQGAKRVQTTKAYALADELKELAYGMLLLTATPMQLHPFELYSLIEVVEPGLFSDFDDYERRRRTLPDLNRAMRGLQQWDGFTPTEKEQVNAGLDRLVKGRRGDLNDRENRLKVMEALVEKHPLAESVVRNRKSQIGGFAGREAHSVMVTMTEDERQIYDDVTSYIRRGYNRAQSEKRYAIGFLMVTYQQMLASSSHAIRGSFQRRVDKLEAVLSGAVSDGDRLKKQDVEDLRDSAEWADVVVLLEDATAGELAMVEEIEELKGLVDRLGKVRDSKASELLTAINTIDKKAPGTKVLIFTRYIETQTFLVSVLRSSGYSVAHFNGSMKLDDKEAEVQRFRDNAQVMVSTEAGGEGRNFQFAHHMVNYDLPWNPMKVEQRIGRLDRIGQEHTVRIINLASLGTVEERILEVLEVRIRLFEESVGSLDPILGEVERDIERLVMAYDEDGDIAFENYAKDLELRVGEAIEKERVMSDFILDHASLRKDEANGLLNRRAMANHNDLRQFVDDCLRYHGGLVDDHSEGGEVFSLPPKLQSILGTKKSTERGVFDPELARQKEELSFFAFGHELIDKIVGLPVGDDNSVTGARRVAGAPPGVSLEVVYEIVAEGFHRSGQLLHHLVGEDLIVQSRKLDRLPDLGAEVFDLAVPEWAVSALEASRQDYHLEYQRARTEILERHKDLEAQEQARLTRVFKYQQQRLNRLIADEEAWIRDKDATGNERERRVLPARRGKLKKNRERLQVLTAELDQKREAIANTEGGASGRLVVAGLVVPL